MGDADYDNVHNYDGDNDDGDDDADVTILTVTSDITAAVSLSLIRLQSHSDRRSNRTWKSASCSFRVCNIKTRASSVRTVIVRRVYSNRINEQSCPFNFKSRILFTRYHGNYSADIYCVRKFKSGILISVMSVIKL